MFKHLIQKHYSIITQALKSEGSYDPQDIMPHIEEELTGPEAHIIFDFLEWVHKSDQTFGRGNYQQVFNEFLQNSWYGKVIGQCAFRHIDCYVMRERYTTGSLDALLLIDQRDFGNFATATVNDPGLTLPENFVLVKDYSENSGIKAALTRACLIEDQCRLHPVGHARAHICKILDPLEQLEAKLARARNLLHIAKTEQERQRLTEEIEILNEKVTTFPFHEEPEEPEYDDTVKFCPECEKPNQFGEICPTCQDEMAQESSGTN